MTGRVRGEERGAHAGLVKEKAKQRRSVVLWPEIKEVVASSSAPRCIGNSIQQSARRNDIPMPRRCPGGFQIDPVSVITEEILERVRIGVARMGRSSRRVQFWAKSAAIGPSSGRFKT